MSLDPETARQIAELAADTRPLLVLDVDDVILDFMVPFGRYLDAHDATVTMTSYSFADNVLDRRTNLPIERERLIWLVDDFFSRQSRWQTLADGASEEIGRIAKGAEVVLLTAMPHKHRQTRRDYLDALGLDYPLLTTEMAKGPALHRLRGATQRPIAFVDDTVHNLESARSSVTDSHLFHLTTHLDIRPFVPALPLETHSMESWKVAGPHIAAALGV